MKCACGKEAVYERKYEGTSLCRQCFLKSIEKKVKRTIRKDKLISPGDKIAVALSGGKDSFLALHIMNEITKNRKDIELIAMTVDPGMKEFKEALKRTKEACKELGIRHYVFTYKSALGRELVEQISVLRKRLPNVRKKDICSCCSVARRWVLNKEARGLSVTKLCTGHNLDDEIQSIMMNYVRGDLMRAVRMSPEPIPYHKLFIPRIKPLREVPENEIALYTRLRGFRVHRARCPYRSGIRFEIGDFLDSREKRHPGMKFSILETFDKFLPHMADAMRGSPKVMKCRNCGEPSSRELCNTCELWGD